MKLKTINWQMNPKARSVRSEGILDAAQNHFDVGRFRRSAEIVAENHPFMDGNKRTAFCILEIGKGKRLCNIKKEFKEWLELLGEI